MARRVCQPYTGVSTSRNPRFPVPASCEDENMFRKRPRVWAVTSSSSGELPSRVAMKRSWRQINRRQKLDEQLFKQALLPLFGLPPEWQGGRFLGGLSSSGNKHRVRAHALTLVHGSIVEGEDSSL